MQHHTESVRSIVEQVAVRARATPNYLSQGLSVSLVTHAAAVGGYSLYLFCAAWLASADLPEWLPARSGVQSRPQTASQAIVLEASYREPEADESTMFQAQSPARPQPPEVPIDAADVTVEPTIDRRLSPVRRVDPALIPVVADRFEQPPADHVRAKEAQRPPATMEPLRRAQVAKRGHGVAINTVQSVASMPAAESHGAETDALPNQLYNPEPDYPAREYAAGIGGTVKVRIRLGDNGRVAQASIYRSSGEAALDQAALQAVRRWRFEPVSSTHRTVRELVFPIRFVPTARRR